METTKLDQPTDDGTAPPRQKMTPWLVAVLVLVGLCAAIVLLPMCIIVVLALLGPSIGNVFSNIVLNI